MAERALADVADERGLVGGPFGSSLVSKDYVDAGVPVIRGTNMLERYIGGDFAYVTPDKVSRDLARNTASPNDVIFTQRGTLGQVSIVPNGSLREYVISQSQMRLRVDETKADPHFVYYACRRPEFLKQITDNAIATGVPHINLGILGRLTIPDLILTQQRAIAEVLGALDDKIAANDQLVARSLELARYIYRRAVNGVRCVPMSSVLTPLLGGTPTRTDDSLWDGTVPWASARDITGALHRIVVSTAEGISKASSSTPRLRVLPAGSVVVTARGTVGVVARLAIAAAINQSCYGFIPGPIPAGALFFAVEDAAEQAKSLVHGSVFDTITMRTFEHVTVPKLDMSEWSAVEDELSALMNVGQQMLLESERLRRSRDELLPSLMSGRVQVRDAEKVVEELT